MKTILLKVQDTGLYLGIIIINKAIVFVFVIAQISNEMIHSLSSRSLWLPGSM